MNWMVLMKITSFRKRIEERYVKQKFTSYLNITSKIDSGIRKVVF